MKHLFSCVLVVLSTLTALAQSPNVSVSSASLLFCEPTYSDVSVYLFSGDTWNGYTFTQEGTYVRIIPNSRGCDSVVTLDVHLMTGAIHGIFSVSNTKKVCFAQGNLQYCPLPSTGEQTHAVKGGGTGAGVFRFAEHQWDYAGDAANRYVSSTSGMWFDFMPFGTSTYQSMMPYARPFSTSEIPSSDIAGTDYDWGIYNAISNGGNVANQWSILSADEWDYLLTSRTDAINLYSRGIVNGQAGVIFLPDAWKLPEGCSFTPVSVKASTNTYTIEAWEKMERAGAVFLPCCGRLAIVNSVYDIEFPYVGYYHTSTCNSGTEKYLYLDSSDNGSIYTIDATILRAISIRLVKTINM